MPQSNDCTVRVQAILQQVCSRSYILHRIGDLGRWTSAGDRTVHRSPFALGQRFEMSNSSQYTSIATDVRCLHRKLSIVTTAPDGSEAEACSRERVC
mmetsp:Transcript_72112/g.160360  ORF Transcript_72112/g.160360 Transcript_72112/m.160360 type:complete len:97 (+) Transcript_72112:108-398(+)